MSNETVPSGRFDRRVVVVTGAASGIGEATAQRFASEGARVACLDVDVHGAERTAATIVDAGGEATGVGCDITDEEQVRTAVERVEQAFGPLDVLFANAGIEGPVSELPDVTLEDFRRVVDVNLVGTFLCTKHAIGSMRRSGGGAIVVTASVCSHIASPLWGAYAATKGGVLQLARSLAIDHRAEGIRVNCVSPDGVNTPLLARGMEVMGSERPTPGERAPGLMLPDDIADAVLFLASDAASSITGTSLLVDQGFTAA